jgi:hypothetical protein
MEIAETMQEGRKEGETARRIETVTSRIPSDVFLWSGVASIIASAALMASGRREPAIFVGQWAPVLFILGLYNKLVKVAGHESPIPDVH